MEQFKSQNTPYLFPFNCLIFCIQRGVECVFVRQDTSSGPFQHHLGASYSWHAAIPCTRAATGLKDDGQLLFSTRSTIQSVCQFSVAIAIHCPRMAVPQALDGRIFSDFGRQRWIKEAPGRYQRSCRTSRRLHQMLRYCPHDMSACLYDSIDM